MFNFYLQSTLRRTNPHITNFLYNERKPSVPIFLPMDKGMVDKFLYNERSLQRIKFSVRTHSLYRASTVPYYLPIIPII